MIHFSPLPNPCVSMSFIFSFFHNSDDVTGLFNTRVRKNTQLIAFPKYKSTENILQKTLKVAFPRV